MALVVSSTIKLCFFPAFLAIANQVSFLRHKQFASVTIESDGASDATVRKAAPTFIARNFSSPTGIAIDAEGKFALVADEGNNVIRKIDLLTGAVSTLSGDGNKNCIDGDGVLASFQRPAGISFSPDSAFVLVCDADGNKIRKVDVSTSKVHEEGQGGTVTTLAGDGSQGDRDGAGTFDRENLPAPKFNGPVDIAMDPYGTFAVVADSANNKIRKVSIFTGVVETLAGSGSAGSADGAGGVATFDAPRGVAVDPHSEYVLVADTGNNLIRKVDLASGAVITLADGFHSPRGIVIEPWGKFALVADKLNHQIRKVDVRRPEGVGAPVTTLAGSGSPGAMDGLGTAASFQDPVDVDIDVSSTYAIVADRSNNKIRKVVLATGAVTTLAGPQW